MIYEMLKVPHMGVKNYGNFLAVAIVILVTTSVLALTGCTSNPPPPPSTNAVSINDFFFSPQNINVHVGDNVTWTNDAGISHTVTSNGTGPMNSPFLSPGTTYTVQFTAVGVYAYHCNIHPTLMWGTVTVT
jgi:plastocyanin